MTAETFDIRTRVLAQTPRAARQQPKHTQLSVMWEPKPKTIAYEALYTRTSVAKLNSRRAGDKISRCATRPFLPES